MASCNFPSPEWWWQQWDDGQGRIPGEGLDPLQVLGWKCIHHADAGNSLWPQFPGLWNGFPAMQHSEEGPGRQPCLCLHWRWAILEKQSLKFTITIFVKYLWTYACQVSLCACVYVCAHTCLYLVLIGALGICFWWMTTFLFVTWLYFQFQGGTPRYSTWKKLANSYCIVFIDAFIRVRKFPSIPNVLKFLILIMNWYWSMSGAFSSPIEKIIWF